MSGAPPSHPHGGLEVDPEEADRKQALRALHFNLVQVPRLRVLGWVLVVVLVAVNNRALFGGAGPLLLPFAVSLAAYCLVSWLLLRQFYERLLPFSLGNAFLQVDLVLLVLSIYVSGGERSLLFFLPLIRVADQVSTTFRRVRMFAHLGVLYYVLLVLYLVRVEGRPIVGAVEAAKILSLYACGLYVSSTALTAERLRLRVHEAIRLSRTLIGELRGQSAELERARTVAEEAARLKTEFLANVTHELRTPMNGILGMTDLALTTELTEEQKDYLTTAHASAESLLRIIDDVLDLSKIEAGRLTLEEVPFRLRETLDESLEPARTAAGGKGLTLLGEVAPNVPDALRGDPTRLRQVLDSLLDNAVRFTERGGVTVKVERETAASGGVRLHFGVADTGIGIAPEKQPLIFDAFAQADGSRTRKYGGMGLGLTLAARLVDKMGGEVRLESAPGQGSTFSFTVPLREAVGATATPLTSPGAPLRAGTRILVIDAQEASRRALERLLAGAGLKPVGVMPGRPALEALERSQAVGAPFALAILDSQTGDVDGFAVARRIKEDPELAATAVVMVATAPRRGDPERCREIGIAAYLARPVSDSELLGAIATALSGIGDGAGAPSRAASTPRAPEAWEILEDGEPDPAGELADQFLADYPRQVAELRTRVEKGDREGVAALVDALRASLANFPAGAALDATAHLVQAVGGPLAHEAMDHLVREVDGVAAFVRALAERARADRARGPAPDEASPPGWGTPEA